jgi:protein ImuB
MKRVISLWLPRFAIDRLAHAPAGRPPGPFALALEQGARRILFAVDAAAEEAGLRPGMALTDARALLPALATAAARPEDDLRALARLAEWCGRWSPWTAADLSVEPIGIGGGGGLWLDATGCAHLFGGEAAMLDGIVSRLAALGLAVRAAMAETPGCAWAVARYAGGRQTARVVPPGGIESALVPLPVAALRLPAGDVAGLHGLGLRRVGELMAAPRAPLARRFGTRIAERLDAALGRRAEPVSPVRGAAPHAVRRAFAEPIGRLEDIAAALDTLSGELCAGLETAALGARRLGLALYRPDGTMARLAVGTARPSRDPSHLARLFADRLETVTAEFGIEAMTLAAETTEAMGAAQIALERADRAAAEDALACLADRLGNRLGPASVRRVALRASHLPERAAELVPCGDGAALSPAGPNEEDALPPRPIRLFRPPEPVEAVAAAEDAPVLFRWHRVEHRIRATEGPERIAPEWWREPAAARTRDYYRVEDTEGRRYWLYRETGPQTVRWYLHGLYG